MGIEYTNEYTNTTEFAYDTGNSRLIKKQSSTNPQVFDTTTYYINNNYEIIHTRDKENNQITIHRRHIYANGKLVTTYDKTLINGEKTLDQAAYMHTDYLGNIVSITGNDGEVQLRQASTPFGERISQGLEINTSEKTNTSQPHFHQDNIKGFTGHEQLSSQGLVHMNARLYDPVLGRMLQSDTMIPDTRDPLAYNRYIYVKNNPLKYTDPTGHWFIVAGLVLLTISATTDDPDVAMVTGIAGMALLGYGLGPAGAGMTAWQSGAIVGGTNAAIQSGGDTEAIARGAAAGALMGGVSDYYGDSYTLGRVGASTVAGGTASTIMGGNFEDGATFAFTTSSMAYLYNDVVGDPVQPEPGEGVYYKGAENPKSIAGANNSGYVHSTDDVNLVGKPVPQEVIDKKPWHEGGYNSKWVNDDLPLGAPISRFHDDMFEYWDLEFNNWNNVWTMPVAGVVTTLGYIDSYNYIYSSYATYY